MEISEGAMAVIECLQRAGFEAFAVGGCVRDSLMGIAPHDYDVATDAPPNEAMRVFKDFRVIPTGIKHGTITVISQGEPVEVTTYRIDGEYRDSRHPDSVSFTASIEEDLSRRDFTINGIAYSPSRGYVDPFGGAEDIARGVIRCIGDADRRFSEDSLRIIRALRFSSTLGFRVDGDTAESMIRNRELLQRVSAERIFTELSRLLCGGSIRQTMLEFSEIFAQIIPYLGEEIGYEQCSPYHDSTLYEHTARAVEAAEPSAELRFAMLLHDIGKPFCRSEDEGGVCHYYGHAQKSTALAEEILRELKCGNAFRERVCGIVRYHDIPVDLSERYIRRQLSKHGLEELRDIFLAHIADDSAKQPFCRERIPLARQAIAEAERIAAEKPCLGLKELAVNGNDLSGIVPPSPEMGRVLKVLLEEVIDGKIPNDREQLLARAKQAAYRCT